MSDRPVHPHDTYQSKPTPLGCPFCNQTLRLAFAQRQNTPYVLYCPAGHYLSYLTPCARRHSANQDQLDLCPESKYDDAPRAAL